MLCLFDIDGTLLIKASADHRAALHAAIRRVYGLADLDGARVESAGRTDPNIARQITMQLGVSADRFEERLVDLKRVAAEEYGRRCRDDLSGHIADGVPEVLEHLAAREDVVLALVTGNLAPIARIKLERAGIGHYFAPGQGGFGSDHEDRTELPGIARVRAGQAGAPYPREETVVIGDTPLDIACAHADGVRCVAVTTGPFDAAALRGADAVIGSARELLGVL
jgi:phosphoglycolate phosphatase-like HAD superfamily hydrolase